jgi:hypothetical protein
MDHDPSPTQDVSFDTALSNAVRLARLTEDADNDPGRRQATAQLAIAWARSPRRWPAGTPRRPPDRVNRTGSGAPTFGGVGPGQCTGGWPTASHTIMPE